MTSKAQAFIQIPYVYEVVAWRDFWAEYAPTSKSVRPIKLWGLAMMELQVSNDMGQWEEVCK